MSPTHQRSLQGYPRKYYWMLFIAESHSFHHGKTEMMNKIIYERYDGMTALEKDKLFILFSKMTDAQKKNPKLLPGEE